ncbi:hypothetical protein [Flavobacterium sp. XS2P14]|uniref:hypothetical protein n=1 Tax=Flavobacterium sp. XS2P14 TaxID=3401735 RepID=UPI003AABF57D
MNQKSIAILLIFTYGICFSQDLISEGTNKWILHTPDDGRTTMWVAPWTNNDWQWGLSTQFLNNGNVLFNGSVGIGTTYPTQKLDVNGNINMAGSAGRRLFMGGAGGSTFGIAYDSNYPNYGIFYTEGEPDYVSISPNGNATAGVMNILGNGNVGIGTTSPDEKLTVNGNIHAKEVKIDLSIPAPDYVFQKYYTGKSDLKSDYTMPTLAEIESFTKKNHHLPNVPSAQEIQQNGLSLGEMSNILLQKVEELTLFAIEQNKYAIEQNKKIMMQQEVMDRLNMENENYKLLAARMAAIEKELKNQTIK